MHSVARILLRGLIDNVQVSWVKLGEAACQTILQGGANDFGGTLMEETISRMAGAEWGIRMEPRQFRAAIQAIGRTPVERTTTESETTFTCVRCFSYGTWAGNLALAGVLR